MNPLPSKPSRGGSLVLLWCGLCACSCVLCLCIAGRKRAPAAPLRAPDALLGAQVAELAAQLAHEPYQPRRFEEQLELGCAAWRAELEVRLERPPAGDAPFVALASLGRVQSLRLAPALAARLRPLALRADAPFGLALEAARALVAGGGAEELCFWCAALESAHDSRSRAIAAGALDALRDGASERLLVERALALGDARAAGRLLDALARALEGVQDGRENPARMACAARLGELAGDAHAEAGLRARALGVLQHLDPQAAEGLARAWFLDAGAGPERIEFAAASLQGCAGALDTLRAARADARLDAVRRVRLAECVLDTPRAHLGADARSEALAELRRALLDSGDAPARRRALHALARHGTDEDRARVQQASLSDPDPFARAAARSSLVCESSAWR